MGTLLRKISLGGLLAALAFMSQVGPDDAVSNMSKWLSKVRPPPDWMKAPEIDTIWTAAFLFFAALVIASYLWPKRKAPTAPRGPIVDSKTPAVSAHQRHTEAKHNARIQAPRVPPKMVRAMRIAAEMHRASEVVHQAFRAADERLRRLEELQERAHLAHGFDPHSQEAKETAILLLAHLRSEGVELRNEAENVVDATLEDWLSEVHEWMNAVIDGIALINEADAEIFRTLDTVPQARVDFMVKIVAAERSNKFLHNYRMHDLRLSRLFDLLQKYQGVSFKRG